MKKEIVVLMLAATFSTAVTGQDDGTMYLGAGNTDGIQVSASSSLMRTSAEHTIDGSGMDAKYMEATRFLAQATLGYEERHVEDVLLMGFEAWIDEQMLITPSDVLDVTNEILLTAKENFVNNVADPDDTDLAQFDEPRVWHFYPAWWNAVINNEDLLRNRIALALSEIFVISFNSDLSDFGRGFASYYEMLLKHSFGNFRELMTDVTLHPCMGFYLSHLNNPRSDPENNIKPDENYAREIMQLFTIGLYQLAADGTRLKDSDGNDLATYDLEDVRELAKVFTGLGAREYSQFQLEYFEEEEMIPPPIGFGIGIYETSKLVPMTMYEEWHEPGQKVILKDHVIPTGQTGMQDIEMALDILFNHQNVGPFISRRLIQHLVKSNPSPQYIARISGIFDDNGLGERGDLAAVVKAILLDEEARTCAWQQDASSGKLREPLIRHTQFVRGMDRATLAKYWGSIYLNDMTKQAFF